MPDPAICVLVDLREERVGGTPRLLGLSLIDDGADERMAERDFAVLDAHEPVELRCLEVCLVEVTRSQRCIEGSSCVGAGSRSEEQCSPRPRRKTSDARPEGPLDPSVHRNRLAELLDASKLCIGERRRQLDERERIPLRELEELPSNGAIEWDPGRTGEQLVGVSFPQLGKLQPGHVAGQLGELTCAGGAQEGDVQVRHVTRNERDRCPRWFVDPLEVVDKCKHGPAQRERREHAEGRYSDGETVNENVSLFEP